MDRMLGWIRDNPQFAAVGFVLLVLGFVMTLLALIMIRAGASLRPLVWFVGFFAIVGGPQAVVHLLDGFVQRRSAAEADVPTQRDPESKNAAGATSAPVPWSKVFEPDADPALIIDARRGLEAVLAEASDSKLSFNPSGDSALAARFTSAAAAAKALRAYGNFFAFADASGTDQHGWTARRHNGQGEWVHIVAAGPELYAWTSASRERVLASRTRALGPWEGANADIASAAAGEKPGSELVSTRLSRQPRLLFAIVALNLVAAVFWFFKGSAWAARVGPEPVARPLSAETLAGNLLALNREEMPAEIIRRPDGAFEVNWRYADARWFDLMRVHRMTRADRLVLSFDEASRTVRVREFWTAFDASAGVDTLRLAWQASTGIQFFAYEHTRVLGAHLGPDGRPTGEWSKAFTFNTEALRCPLIAAVTQAGWRWQPVVWNTPAALRWLAE